MNAKRILAIAIAMIGLYACQKEPISDSQNILMKKSSPNYWTDASNSDNPYEHLAIGVYHNNCLEYFRLNSDQYSSEAEWIESRFQLSLDFFCFGSDTTYCDNNVSLDDLIHIDSIALNDSLFYFQIEKLSPETNLNIINLLNFLKEYEMFEFDSLKQDIIALEELVQSDSTISSNEKTLFLIASQVSRYSSLYWKEQIEQSFYGWTLSNSDRVGWAETVAGDIKGAIIGYIYGLSIGDPIATSIKGGPTVSSSQATKSSSGSK